MRALICLAALTCSLSAHVPRAGADSVVRDVKSKYAAPDGKALVILVRERLYSKATKFRLVNAKGQCVSVIKGERHVLLPLDPGKHRLYLLVGTTKDQAEALQLDVTAGRTYVVDIHAQWRRKDYMDIRTVRPGTERATKAFNAIRDTDLFTADLEQCAEWISKKQDDVARKIAFAEKQWAAGDEAYRSAHTLNPNDGFGPAVARKASD